MKRHKRFARITSHLLSAFSAFLLVTAVVCTTCFFTVYSGGYFKDICKKSAYYSESMKSITSKIAKIENQTVKLVTGAKEVSRTTSVMANTVTWSNLEQDINAIIDANYSKGESAYNSEKAVNMFYNAVIDDCRVKKITLFDDDKTIIRAAANDATKVYEDALNKDVIDNYCTAVNATKSTTLIILAVCLVGMAVISVIHYKNKNKYVLKYFVPSLLSSGGVLFILPMLSVITGYIGSLNLTADHVQSVLVSAYISGIMCALAVFGMIFIILALVIGFCVYPRITEYDI